MQGTAGWALSFELGSAKTFVAQQGDTTRYLRYRPCGAPTLAELRHQLERWNRVAAAPVELRASPGGTVELIATRAEGHDLSTFVGPAGSSGPDETPRLERLLLGAARAARALAALHASGVVHHNLKPSNVFVSARGAVLLDPGSQGLVREALCHLRSPYVLERVLPYLAPEQTGRVGGAVDGRADLYALGVALYEVLAGATPFASSDPQEVIHGHLARRPPPLHERCAGLPQVVVDIIARLLEKDPERRYQSAQGLLQDLESCGERLHALGALGNVVLCHADVAREPTFDGALYGRSGELAQIEAAFLASSQGPPTLLVIAGPPGIGKSTLGQSVIVSGYLRNCYVGTGKCDQLRVEQPYFVLRQALTQVVDQLLFEPEDVLRAWRQRFEAAVGGLGGVLVELCPALERIIGATVSPAPLELVEARARLQLAVQQLATVVATRERPLVLFLDDLQWADAGTLELLEVLLTRASAAPILVVGSYRSTEVSEQHPVSLAIRALESRGVPVRALSLGALCVASVADLLAASLRVSAEEARPLAEAVHEKTLGNPFFMRMFLLSLGARGLLRFEGRWLWSVSQIRAESVGANVVTLLRERMQGLSGATRQVLEYAAIAGHVAELADLVHVLACDQPELVRRLQPAVSAGLIRLSEGRILFLHDRVQEAALLLGDAGQRASRHLELAKVMGDRPSASEGSLRLFERTFHLNAGRAALPESERLGLARINLQALGKARRAAAFGTAIELARAGMECLTPDDWRDHPALCFELHHQEAELTFHQGDFARAEALATRLEQRAESALQRASAKGLRLKQYIVQGRFDEAIHTAQQALALLEVDLPVEPERVHARFASERARTETMLAGREPAELFANPTMADPAARLGLELLVRVNPAIFFKRPDMLGLNIVLMANLSLEYGHTPASAFAYAEFGFLCALESEDYARAYELTLLGLRLANESQDPIQICRVTHLGAWIQHYVRPLGEADELFQLGFRAGSESGEAEWAAYHAYSRATRVLLLGTHLDAARDEIERLREYVRRANSAAIVQLMDAVHAQIDPLRQASDRQSLDRESAARVACWRASDNPQALFIHHAYRSFSLLLERRHAEALEHAETARPLALQAPNHPFVELVHFVRVIASLAALPSGAGVPAIAAAGAQRLELLAQSCPTNYGARRALVRAELGRVRGDGWASAEHYAEACRLAFQAGFVQEEGLAHQLAAQLWSELGQSQYREAHLGQAHACWVRWGALHLARRLEADLPRARESGRDAEDARDGFDARSLIKASQAISGELDRSKLLSRMMHVILENAGAEWGALISPHATGLQVVVTASSNGSAELSAHELADDARVLVEVVRYVQRSGGRLVLADAGQDARFSGSPRIQQRRVRSVLCLPLGPSDAPQALLYLENTLTTGAFTPDRLAMVEVLANQASISLENAALYARTQLAEQTLRASEADLRITLDSLGDAVIATDALGRVTRMNPVASELTGWSLADARGRHLSEVLSLMHGESREPIEDAAQRVLQTERALDRVQDTFLLARGGRERRVSQSGAPIRDARGEVVGVVLVFRDVTERHELEERVRHGQKMDALGQLAGGVAHDFNNMLAGILGSAEFLKAKLTTPSTPQVASALQTVIDSALRARGLTQQLLAFSRKGRRVCAPVNLHQVIGEALSLLEHSIDRRIVIETAFAPEAPVVRGDGALLQAAVLNLGINARDAMPEGGRLRLATRLVTLGAAECQKLAGDQLRSGEYVELEVRDEGCGIPASILSRVFEPFFTTKAIGQGTGLGLAAVHGTVVQHGGAIRATSDVGAGTTFRIWLPRERSEAVDVPAPPPLAAPGRRLTVLVVDDESVARVTMQRLLESLGHRVLAASDGQAGAELFRCRHAELDLVLLDWIMPGLDGRSAFRRIRAIDAAVPVVIASGFMPEAALDELGADGLAGFLMKPFSRQDLIAMMEKVAPQHRRGSAVGAAVTL